MRFNKFFISALFLSVCLSITSYTQSRWHINENGSISWNVYSDDQHYDHIEMSGLKVSTVLRYGIDEHGSFIHERGMVWPMLRTIPNDTHASLMRRLGWNPLNHVRINRRPFKEKVNKITLDGTMKVESTMSTYSGNIHLTRILFPSTVNPAFLEKYIIVNHADDTLKLEIDNVRDVFNTAEKNGVDGSYTIIQSLIGGQLQLLAPNDSLTFYVTTAAYKKGEVEQVFDVEDELSARTALVSELWNSLILETPDSVINTMFDFAKIRASESIYQTACGLLHGPGGESYYAAIWANDQAEYVNPFFPYLGYEKGNNSAFNSYMQFSRFMNDEYNPIPSSIIAEGKDIWNGAGDRGDAAMIAYGASRYALSLGAVTEAEKLWPLIEWCLEYCKRRLNNDGVVASDTDELEGRFPAGDANLCTSSLYYDALQSAAFLGKSLKKSRKLTNSYLKESKLLRNNIEKYFGSTVEGFQTYQYFKGNDILRSWICIPLTVNIFDRKDETLKALFSHRLWTENGLLTEAGSDTYWDRSTLYALRGVYACDERDLATDYLHYYSTQRLLGEHVPYPIEAWPEGNQRHLSAESGLYCRIITEGLFGIRPTSLNSFIITPQLPTDWNDMSLKNIHTFGTTVDINVSRVDNDIMVTVYSSDAILLQKTIKNGESITIYKQ